MVGESEHDNRDAHVATSEPPPPELRTYPVSPKVAADVGRRFQHHPFSDAS